MPSYRYRAVDFSGRIARGSVAAANEWELAQNLSQSGLELIDAKASRASSPEHKWRLPRSLPPHELARFASQTADLLRAGINLPEVLRDMGTSTASSALRDALDDILRSINHGCKISTAFAKHPRLFPDVFIAILAAGEKSGDLVATFDHLARYTEARARTIEQMRRAIRYPLFLLFVTISVVVFMATMVIPQIVQFLSSIDSQLPLTTRILIGSSDILTNYWWAVLLVIGFITGGLFLAQRYSESTALRIDNALLHLPFLGPLLHKLALARFAHSFAILQLSGGDIVGNLRGAAVTLNNRALKTALEDTVRQVQSGKPLSVALTTLFPLFAIHMVRIGERSSNLGKSLNDIAATLDREVNEASGRLIGAMEPALTLVVGGIMGWIVLAVLGPIYSSLSKISGGM